MNLKITRILWPLVAMILTSCGSSDVEKKNEFGEDYIDNLNNSSFQQPKAIDYREVDDFLDENFSSSENVLQGESLGKIEPSEISPPQNVEKNLDKALVSCYRGQFDYADQVFDLLYKEYRENPIYWTQVGSCFYLRGSLRKALLYYNKAKSLKGQYAPPVNNIGVIFENKGFDQKAMEAYNEAKKMSSFSLTPLFNLAQLYTKYGFITEGRSLFQSLIKLNSKDQDARFALGFLEMLAGDASQAIQIYQSLNQLFWESPETGSNIAYAYLLTNQKEKAIDILNGLRATSNSELSQYINQLKQVARN